MSVQSSMSREEECFKEKGVVNCLRGGDSQVTGSLRINTWVEQHGGPGEADRSNFSGVNRGQKLD